MSRTVRASLFAVVVLGASAGLAVRLAVAADPPPAGASSYKNLKVLPKTISKPELKALMKAQAKALGVECDFCHEEPDMSSDNNPHKEIARRMMQMTDEINARWMKGLKDAEKNPVTCGSCHRGEKHPPKF